MLFEQCDRQQGGCQVLEVYQIEAFDDNYIYVLKSNGVVAVVDPGDAAPVLSFLHEMEWKLDMVLVTHHHHDHVAGILKLQSEFDCHVVGFEDDQGRIPGFNVWVRESDEIEVGSSVAEVIEIPGHTTGHIAYYFKDDGLLFCGDTLFSLGCGRLFEGTPEQMWTSLQKIKALPDDTQVFCAHEYTQSNGRFALKVDPDNQDLHQRCEEVDDLRDDDLPTVPSFLSVEKKSNPFLRADDASLMQRMEATTPLECFTKLRQAKDKF